jgi:myo-inositol-1(or 4)-monophosphatase
VRTNQDHDPGPDLEMMMIRWCKEGAEIARHHHRRTGELEFKQAREAVTEADREIENLLRDRIGEAFPEDIIVGEEYGGPGSQGELQGRRVWQIDPIDGTLNYALGMPNYCTSLGLMSGDNVLAACIHQPSTGDTFSALAGRGARLNGTPMRVSSDRDLKESILSLQLKKEGSVMGSPQLLHQLACAPWKLRRCGAVALEMAWVAAGFYDALLASFAGKIHSWDIAAGLLLVAEAGGVAVDFQGRPYPMNGPEMVVGSGQVAQQLVSLLNKTV